jgi:hypothetical protein
MDLRKDEDMPWNEIRITVGKHGTLAMSFMTFLSVLWFGFVGLSIARDFVTDMKRHVKNDVSFPEMSRWCLVNKYNPQVLKDIHEEYNAQLGIE